MRDNQIPGPNYNVVVPINDNRLVSQPAICANLASRCDVFCKERPQTIGGSIWDARKSDTANAFRFFCDNRNILDRDGNEHLIVRTTAPLSRSFATDVRLINLHRPHQSFTTRTNHCASEPMKPLPGRVVAAKSKKSLQTKRVRPIFLVGNVPHRLKPDSQRFSSLMENSPGGYRNLGSTLLAKEQATRHFPSAASTAFRALETIRPSKGSQVSGACFFRGEAVPEFRQSSRVVFHTRTLHVVGG